MNINLNFNREIPIDEVFKYYETIVHCTTKYFGSNQNFAQDVIDYVNDPNVSLNNGKAFEIKVTGFSISNNTICKIFNKDLL